MALRLQSEAARSIAGTALTGALANVGAITASPARVVLVFNGCDEEIVLSWDGGTTEGFIMPPTSAFAIDGPTNADTEERKPFLPVGAQFQAKHNGSVPTSGTLTISVIT